jgi:hypothetical protein
MRAMKAVGVLIFFLALTSGISCFAQEPEYLVYHPIRTDAHGDIMPWYGSGPSEAYDHDIRLLWNFWYNMRNCENGVPYYLHTTVRL